MATEMQLAFMHYEDMVSRRACGDRSDAAVQKARERIESLLATNQGAAEPVAQWQVRRDARCEWDNIDADEVEFCRKTRGYEVRALYATPPAVMPAAPSDAEIDALLPVNPFGGAALTHFNIGQVRQIVRAALSQTMQPQAERGYLGSTVDGGIDDHDEDRPHQDNPGATQDAGPDAGATGSTSGPGADQHHQHRVGKADDHRACAECNSQGAGVSGESAIREVVAGQKAEPAAGEQAGAVDPSDVRRFLKKLVTDNRKSGAMFPQIADEIEADDEAHQRILKLIDFYHPSEAAAPGAAIAAREQEADASTPGTWFVRKREHDGELLDCFIAAPDVNGFAYDAEILGDDEYREDTGMVRKLADCELICKLVNAHRAALASRAEAPATPQGEIGEVLLGVDALLREAYAHWDADREFKVGKILLALIGHNKRYDKRADAWCDALKGVQPVERGEG